MQTRRTGGNSTGKGKVVLPKDKLSYLTRPLDFAHVTALVLILHALVSGLGYLILGPSPYISGYSLLLIIAMDAAICLALCARAKNNGAHIVILAWFVIMYFCVRLTALLFFPPHTLEFLIAGGLTGEEIFVGLPFIVGGVVALLLGILLAGRLGLGDTPSNAVQSKQFALWSITGYWLITYLAAYYVRIYLGVTIFGPPEHWGNRMAWVGIIFDTDVALLLTICWAAIQLREEGMTRHQWGHVTLLVLLWLAFSIWVGSRGGPLRIMNCIFLISLAINPKFKLSFVRFAALIIFFFMINYFVFAAGTIFRGYHLGGNDLNAAIISHQAKLDERMTLAKPMKVEVSEVRTKFYDSDVLIYLAMKLQQTVTRLALFDYPIIIISKIPDGVVIDKYITSLHPMRNFINNMVPGEIFEDSMVNTSRVFTMAYRGTSLNAINEGFMSEPWTIWGMSWIFAKYFGIALMFAVSFGMQVGFNYVGRIFRGHAIFVRTVYFIIIINIGYIMFGIDHWLTAIAHFSISCFIAYLILVMFESLGARMGRLTD